jgi:TonB family protein
VNKPPPYPQRGQNARQEFDGKSVLLQIEVLADGTTGKIRTLEGIGGDGIDPKVARGVERSVIKAVKKWRWHPGKLDDVAVSASIRHRVKFELPALDD